MRFGSLRSSFTMRSLAIASLTLLSWGLVHAEPPKAALNADETTATKTAESKLALDKAIMSEIQDNTEIMKNLGYLSDVIGPRLTGSANLERANKWAAEKMKEYGLTNVRLEPWEIPVGWERGSVSMKLVDPGEKILIAASAGWAPGTNGKITGEVVILNITKKEDLEQYKGKLKNAIVLRGNPANVGPVIPPPPPADRADNRPGPMGDRPAPRRAEAPPRSGPDAANRYADLMALRREMGEFFKAEGVAAVITDSAKPHGLLVTTGSWRQGDRGNQPEGPTTLYVAHEHYALLHRLITEYKIAPKVELEVTNRFIPGPVTVYNTVGELPGSEKPDEFVVLGAHIDSWDLASGTTDNGTGTSVVLESARTLAKLARQGMPPKRTIRFVLFSGEEQGLFGSKEYVRRHMDEMPRTSMALVHDTGTGKVLSIGTQNRPAVVKVLAPELESLTAVGFEGLTLASSGGTDHLSFDARDVNVPGFACKQDPDEYRFTHHTQSDTFDKAKEPNLIQGAQVMAVTAMRVANLPEMLPRDRPQPMQRRRGEPEPKKDAPKPEEPKKGEPAPDKPMRLSETKKSGM